jgi:pyridoxal phosphate enzyme (YggS family)
MNQQRLRDNLASVRSRIADAAARAGRHPESITLVAVTKRNSPEAARALLDLGLADLGENYPQELWRKAEALSGSRAVWHLIGHLQSNKAKRTFPLVTMIHAVDSLKLLQVLDELAPTGPGSAPPRVCLQVNTSAEPAKHGWSPEQILADAEAVAGCRRIPIVGLMTMAALGTTAETARPSFVQLRETRDRLAARTGLALPELSMGMSNDLETAIEEGATLVRVGSDLFEGVEE